MTEEAEKPPEFGIDELPEGHTKIATWGKPVPAPFPLAFEHALKGVYHRAGRAYMVESIDLESKTLMIRWQSGWERP